MSKNGPAVPTPQGTLGNANWNASIPILTTKAYTNANAIGDGTRNSKIIIGDIDVEAFLLEVADRLMIITKHKEDIAQHPALQAAYDNFKEIWREQQNQEVLAAFEKYKIIEQLLNEKDNED